MLYQAIGKNSEVFSVNDPVTITAGVVEVAGTTETIFGVCDKTVTMTSDNQTVAKVVPPLIPTDGLLFLMGCNADLTGNATDGGTYYKLTTATSGAVQIDVASGVQTTTARVVEIVQVDPQAVGGTGAGSGLRQALIRFVKTPNSNVAITT